MASTSETGHAKNVANLDDLISFVTGYGTTYNPSKSIIKLTTLQTLYNDLKAKNTAVVTATTPLSNSRISRNDILYI